MKREFHVRIREHLAAWLGDSIDRIYLIYQYVIFQMSTAPN